MAGGNFFRRLFGVDDTNSNIDNQNRIEKEREINESESTGTTLQDAVNFVAELQSYYYNDICKMQTDLLVQTTLTQSRVNFINKKIKQDQVTLSQIDEILDLVQQNEREFQSVWRKSVYSFYDEIEKAKLTTVQKKVFAIILKLCAINTKPELKSIIFNRIEKYKDAWSIDQEIQIPKNYNVVLIEEDGGIEKYQFGDFCKNVFTSENDRVLSAKQIDNIRTLKIEFEEEILTDKVWVYVSSVTRFQLNYMRRSCIIDNDWEYEPDTKGHLCFDIVKVTDLEQYLKGILQIVLTKKTYAVISIVIPTNSMLRVIRETKVRGEKVEICRKYRFYLEERSGLYGKNLLTARVDRRNIPKSIQFVSYLKFKKAYF